MTSSNAPMHTWTAPNGITINSQVPADRPRHDRLAITHLAWSYQYSARRILADIRGTRGPGCTLRKAHP